ncbi:MAG: DUF4430 domain-containing protein [Clostridiales bacterium]
MKNKTIILVLLMAFVFGLCFSGCGDVKANESAKEKTEDKYIDVDSVDSSSDENMDKYAEKTDTQTTNATDATTANTTENSDVSTGGNGAGGATGNTAGNNGAGTSSDSSGEELDKYKTEAIPSGEPAPVEPDSVKVNTTKKLSCTFSIECSTILSHMADFNPDKISVLPKDGIVYATRKVTFAQGESVFDVLQRETKANKIHLESSFTPMYNSAYIEGINNLYEFDCGENSGWMYCVNTWYPNYGCSRYQLKDGDVVEWHFTTDLGRDLGQDNSNW